MIPGAFAIYDESDALVVHAEEVEEASEDDLWFLPGPMEDERDHLPPGPRAGPREPEVVDEWRKAEGGQMEAAVTAERIAASETRGAVFVPLAMGGQGSCAPMGHRSNVWNAGSTGWRPRA